MPSLLITKQPNDFFSFVLDGDYANEIKNIRNDLLTVGNYGHFKTSNGANLIKYQNITPSDVTIVDGATTLNPTTTDGLFDSLRSVGYFDWMFNSGTGGVDRFVDLQDTFGFFGQNGKTVMVDEAQQKLVPVNFYNVQKFTDLSDVPNAYVSGKIIMSTDTGLIFVDLPPAPVDPNALQSGGYPGTGEDLNQADINLQNQINNLIISIPPARVGRGVSRVAAAGQTVFDIGTNAICDLVFWNGSPLVYTNGDWTQSGTEITLGFTANLDDLFIFI